MPSVSSCVSTNQKPALPGEQSDHQLLLPGRCTAACSLEKTQGGNQCDPSLIRSALTSFFTPSHQAASSFCTDVLLVLLLTLEFSRCHTARRPRTSFIFRYLSSNPHQHPFTLQKKKPLHLIFLSLRQATCIRAINMHNVCVFLINFQRNKPLHHKPFPVQLKPHVRRSACHLCTLLGLFCQTPGAYDL